MKKITVKFIESYPPYMKGETATFFEREASRLCDRGFAMYVGGDEQRDDAASRLRALRGAPEDRAVHGPETTRHIAGPTETKNTPEGPSRVEGGGNTRKCGLCGQPGHTRNNCPKKK